MDTSQKNRIIKKALVKAFKGIAKVSVKGATGTATGWVDITLEFQASEMLFDTQYNDNNQERRDHYNKNSALAEVVARDALAAVGEKFYTFSSDDGYGTERECVNTSVHYR